MNRLQHETSAYLLQHSHNPVDWYPWGDEAFSRARMEDKPIFLSIGYSSCHWCHVMERESFNNESVAELMNRHFVNIKVDREERPDVDNVYMNFVQMATGSGGWPLSVFLTPDLIPFYGGTYFPPSEMHGRISFPRLLEIIIQTYRSKRDEIDGKKEEILESLTSSLSPGTDGAEISGDKLLGAFQILSRSFDGESGGFGSAPKFPSPMIISFLLKYYHWSGEKKAFEMADKTLRRMAMGGIHDQVGGGFHRYSTDSKWLVPHFEKMLYDNAQLAVVYLEAYQISGDACFHETAICILDYLEREMLDNCGAFYSSQDADSEGEEGKFFVWNDSELKEILTGDEYEFAREYYKFSPEGNFQGKNILTSQGSAKKSAELMCISEAECRDKLSNIRAKLRVARNRRVKPATDRKIITSWNALAVSAFAKAAAILGPESYLKRAIDAAEFLWNNCYRNGNLYHIYKEKVNPAETYLEDYSYLINAYTDLYAVTFDEMWINRAAGLAEVMLSRFTDDNGIFYQSLQEIAGLPLRSREIHDNALPSGNSSAVSSLIRLFHYTVKSSYLEIAGRTISGLFETAVRYPFGFSSLLSSSLMIINEVPELNVIFYEAAEKEKFVRRLYSYYLPFVIPGGKLHDAPTGLETLKGKKAINGKTTYYLCRNSICTEPASDFEDVLKQILKGI